MVRKQEREPIELFVACIKAFRAQYARISGNIKTENERDRADQESRWPTGEKRKERERIAHIVRDLKVWAEGPEERVLWSMLSKKGPGRKGKDSTLQLRIKEEVR